MVIIKIVGQNSSFLSFMRSCPNVKTISILWCVDFFMLKDSVRRHEYFLLMTYAKTFLDGLELGFHR